MDDPDDRQAARDFAKEAGIVLQILRLAGQPLPPGAKVLDLGCGAGGLVRAFADEGFDAYGCDIVLETETDRLRKISEDPYRMPFEDDVFDSVVSLVVFEHVQNYQETLREIRRVLRPGGVSLHIFPPRWRIREGHVYVPFASVVQNRAWLRLWAQLGIRNEFQQDKSAAEVVELNQAFLRDHTTYYPRRRVLREARAVFPRARLAEMELLAAARSPKGQLAYRVAKRFPPLATLACELRNRALLLQ